MMFKRLIAKNHNRLLFIDKNQIYEQILLDNFRPSSSRYKSLEIGDVFDDNFKLVNCTKGQSFSSLNIGNNDEIFLLLTSSTFLRYFSYLINVALLANKHHLKVSFLFLSYLSEFIKRPLIDLNISYYDIFDDNLINNIARLSQNHCLFFTSLLDKNETFKLNLSQKGNIFLKYLYYLNGDNEVESNINSLELNLLNICYFETKEKTLKQSNDNFLIDWSFFKDSSKFNKINSFIDLYNYYFLIGEKNILISPSILTLPKNKIKGALKKLYRGGADYLHFDVMDGIFVSNKTYSIDDYKEIKKNSLLINDVHLMVQNVDNFVDEYLRAGVDILTFHYEAINNENHLLNLIDKIHHHDVRVGVSIKPDTDVRVLLPYLDKIDVILIMSVEPGKGGQSYLDNATDKIYFLDQYRKENHLSYLIEVDGGINEWTSKIAKAAGVDILVAGTFIVNHSSYQRQIEVLKND